MANKRYLYDKAISVTLYRPPQITEPKYKVQVALGYVQNAIPKSKIDYIRTKGLLALKGSNPPSACIEFYPSTTREVFLGYRTTEQGMQLARYRRIEPRGAVIKIDTIEQMKKGYTPAGVLFKTGNRILVREDSSQWNVYVRDGSEAEAEDSSIIERDADTLVINCTDYGIKPDIALSINVLPGQNCYGAVLKIRNFNLDAVDIRSWERMVITAGYRTGKVNQYTCPIFTSYIESPNPDGVTVFEGITVGTADDVLYNQELELHFVQEWMTLKEFIEEVAHAVSPNIKVNNCIDDDIVLQEIHISKQIVYAQNGMAVISWLQSTATKFIEELSIRRESGERVSAFIQFHDNTLDVIALNGPNKHDDIIEGVVNLDMVTGATFNGTALTVEAPWNPDMQPGGLFCMPPQFINGSKLPNVLPTTDYMNDENLYRVLTMAISFASVEAANKMTLLAIPAQWVGELPSEKTTEMRGDVLAASLSKQVQGTLNKKDIGRAQNVDLSKVNNINSAPSTNKDLFDKGQQFLSLWGSWIAMDVDSTRGDCISKMLDYYFHESLNGPRLTRGTKGTGSKDSSYFKPYNDFKSNANAQRYFQNSGCWCNSLWWPLVVVGTYWRKWSDDNNNVSNNWSRVNILNPNFVEEKKAIYIPVFGLSWEAMQGQLTAVRDVWKFAYQGYKDLYPEMCRVWRAMYYYMGGQGELD